MRLTTKGRLAVVAMIDVALHQKSGPVALTAIARRQRISLSYLEQMVSDLRRHGLAVSTRGPGGGYMIARALGEITAADIVLAVDRMNADSARGDGACASEGDGRCLTPELWTSLSRCVIEFLDSVSLQKLVDEQIANGVKIEPHEQPAKRAVLPPTRAPSTRPKAPNSVFELGKFQAG